MSSLRQFAVREVLDRQEASKRLRSKKKGCESQFSSAIKQKRVSQLFTIILISEVSTLFIPEYSLSGGEGCRNIDDALIA